jgi:AcrR family transcriptional regulator
LLLLALLFSPVISPAAEPYASNVYGVYFAGKTKVAGNVNDVNIAASGKARVIMTGMNAHAGAQAATEAEPASEPSRARYHHGDLANALTQAGVALAREGGPDAVVLREAARRVGVSPAAAYRHFASHDELQYAVKLRAQQELADAMDAAIESVESTADPASEALQWLGAIGAAYVHFALDEPGLFRTAFCRVVQPSEESGGEQDHAHGVWHGRTDGAARTDAGLGEAESNGVQAGESAHEVSELARYRPFQMLSEGLDRLVAVGILQPDRRPNAEIPAWSMVHGLATLVLDGPLRLDDEAARDAALELALRTIMDGLLH